MCGFGGSRCEKHCYLLKDAEGQGPRGGKGKNGELTGPLWQWESWRKYIRRLSEFSNECEQKQTLYRQVHQITRRKRLQKEFY